MTKFTFVFGAQGLSILAFTLGGCSAAPEPVQKEEKTTKGGSTSGSGAGTGTGTGTDTGTDTKPTEPTTPAPVTEACSVTGDKGNAMGVGKFCSKTVDECGTGTFCQAAFAPEGAQFCTKLCTADKECGDDAVCFKEARGSACVPNKCLDK